MTYKERFDMGEIPNKTRAEQEVRGEHEREDARRDWEKGAQDLLGEIQEKTRRLDEKLEEDPTR